MKRVNSISFRLSAIFFTFFFIIVVLGLFGIGQLSNFNRASSDLGTRWLPKTRFIGDLNNYTSDFRAAEASSLLSSDSEQFAAIEKETAEISRSISTAMQRYEQTPQGAEEVDLYGNFIGKWNNYLKFVDQEKLLARAGRKGDAINIYMTTSQTAYNAASDMLGNLTDRNVAYALAATKRVDEAYQQARWLISAAMLFAGALITVAILYMKQSISRPLLRLAGDLRRLAVNDTSVEIQATDRHDEIGEMARAAVVFRANAIELMLTQRGLVQEASKLAEKLEHEQRLAQSQRNFVSMVSHEFRTPLTIIDALAQRLIRMNDRLRPDYVIERAGRIRRAVSRMTNMIGDLLDAARLMEGDAHSYFSPTEVDLRPLLKDVCQLHREISPGSEIVENFDTLSAKLSGDPKLLFQMFSNLLSNAVKYSTAGNRIRVNGTVDAKQIAVEIQDQGIGIPEKDINQLFKRYSRGGNVSGIVGSGIGLYIVKTVVELHSGEIAVESKEGYGSRFIVRLPIIQPLKTEAVASSQPAMASKVKENSKAISAPEKGRLSTAI
jgi:signal transduction histidine kinase